GVDARGRAAIRPRLAEERPRGATLFLNSHLLSETERVCDRIGILSDGRLVREGELDALCGSASRYRVRFAPGCPVEALRAAGFGPIAEEPPRDGEPVGFACDAGEPEALNRLLDKARAAGALLVELRRDMRDLEDVLADAVGGAPGERP